MATYQVSRWYNELGDYYEWHPEITDGVVESGGELVHVIPGVDIHTISVGTLEECRPNAPEGLTEETEDRDIPEPTADTDDTSADSGHTA